MRFEKVSPNVWRLCDGAALNAKSFYCKLLLENLKSLNLRKFRTIAKPLLADVPTFLY